MSTSKTYPRSVSPGIETHLGYPTVSGVPFQPGVFCTIDWIRGTCPFERFDDLVRFCDEHFGESARRSTPAKHFKHGLDWPNGVKLSHGHNADIAMLDVRGQWLSQAAFADRVAMLKAMVNFPLKLTRVDLALDYLFQNRNIYSNALASCEREELCILRNHGVNSKFGRGGVPSQLSLHLGDRESMACAKIYDKGLEQKLTSAGVWERIESEFKKDKAQEVARILLSQGAPEDQIPELVLGTFDFRERNGRSELARRPRVEWWNEIVADRGIRVRLPSGASGFEKWWDAMIVSYGRPILRFADLLRVEPGRLFRLLTDGQSPSDSRLSFEDDLERVCELLGLSMQMSSATEARAAHRR